MTFVYSNNLFVYGTLINKDVFEFITDIKPDTVEEGWIRARMYSCGHFPMVIEDSEKKVHGRVYTIGDLEDLLPTLDEYEQCNVNPLEDALYIRKVVEVTLEPSEEVVSAWAYIGNPSSEVCRNRVISENEIAEGRWPDRLK
jgi:gamma-glutamylcyclotransferase (GGCT)/AIG2-like uncharacterized protein YtfP